MEILKIIKARRRLKFFRGVLGVYQGGNGHFVQKTASGEPKFGAILKNNKKAENFVGKNLE